MRLVNLYDERDQEILIDMDIKPTPVREKEPFQDWFQNRIADWLESRIAWGKPTLIIAAAVTAISIISMVGVMRGETQVPNKLHMTEQEISHVMKNLERRSAADCVLTRTETGFQCKEMATGKVYMVNGK